MVRLQRWPQIATLFALALALGYLAWLGWGLLPSQQVAPKDGFDGERALALAKNQCDIGPRPAGSPEDWRTADLILEELQRQGWKTAEEEYVAGSKQLRNVAGLAGDEGPLLIVATHYDTRSISDQDANPARRNQPSPGANDGASGVATLLELARALDTSRLKLRVWLLFLDGEADAGLAAWDESSGARHFVDGRQPDAVIYLNMVGAVDAQFAMSPDANDLLQTQLWKLAARLGYENRFIPEPGPVIEDAHTVFLHADIPTAEIIQPDYPYARTSEDACDKLDAATLKAVGVLLESYIENNDFLTIAPSLKTP
jgi:hypothetical protein